MATSKSEGQPNVGSAFMALLRQLEMREKRQRQTLEDTVAQIEALKRQLNLPI